MAAFTESWYFYAGIVLLISFLPFTFVSYRTLRLPRKEIEHERIIENLKNVDIEDAHTLIVSDRRYSQWDYALPLLFVTIFSLMAFCLMFCEGGKRLLSVPKLVLEHDGSDLTCSPALLSMLIAFLGAYIWSIRYILRRLITIDLPPAAYYGVGVRMVLSTFVSLIFYYFISALPSGELMSGRNQGGPGA